MSFSFGRGLVLGVTLWGAVSMFDPSMAAAKAPTRDLDRDGVADRLDLCQGTLGGAKIVSQGCSALDVALSSEALVDFSLGELGVQKRALSKDLAMASAVDRLEGVAAELSRAGTSMRSGDVCGAAGLAEASLGELAAAREEIQAIAHGNALVASWSAEKNGGEASLAASLLPSLVAQPAFDRAAQLAPLYRAACSEVVGKFRAHGVVSEVRDDLRMFRIGKGERIGLAEGHYRTGPIERIEIEARGIEFADGSRLATWVEVPEPQVELIKTQQCLNLRVAPFWAFPPYGTGPWPSFPIEGYQNSFGVADLERNQRFAAVDLLCPTSSGLSTYSYSMQIVVTQGANTWTIASDLKKTSPPVGLPSGFLDNTQGQVAATVFRTSCFSTLCSTTTLGTHTVGIFVRPYGTYATAVYDKTVFDVAGDFSVNDHEPASVTGFNLSVIGASNNPSFQGRGYRWENVNDADSWVSIRYTNQPFAIYDWDELHDDEMYDDEAYGFGKITEFNSTGVDHPAGIVWPWVRGTRNGFQFAYGAKLPILARDRITNCAGSLDSFYQQPFHGSNVGVISVTKGNFDDAGAAHGGSASFALDFQGPSGWDIYPARGGNVFALDDSHSANLTEPTTGGNYLVVQHPDGTFGLYWNIAQNSLSASLGLGTRLFLDSSIAKFGAGKLHFEAGNKCHPTVCSSTTGYNSAKALYHAYTETFSFPYWVSTERTCYLPRTGDKF